MKRLKRFFQNPVNLALLNALSLAAIVIANIFWQVFCVPTPWAIVALAISCVALVGYPFVKEKKGLELVFACINGISACIFMYCVFFLGNIFILVLFLMIVGVGFLIVVPHLIVFQLGWKYLFKPVNQSSRIAFITGIIISLSFGAYCGYLYNDKAKLITSSLANTTPIQDDSWMTERILGMHFIYHTRICLFDGWRPPKHDPALVVGMWLNGNQDPIDINLAQRLALYKTTFPDRPYKFDCSCAIEEGSTYHADKLWKP